MSTIIDSLIVELKLEAKDISSKAGGVQKSLEGIESSASKAEQGFSSLSGAVKTFGAVLGGLVGAAAVTALAKDLIATNTQLYYMSQNLGMSAQKLYAWGQMARQVGGSAGDVQGFFHQVRGMYGQLLTGQSPALLPLFARLGINGFQSPDKIMEQLSERFKGDDTGPNRWKAASFLEASGLSEGVVNMILQGPAWVKSHEKELSALSPSDQQLKASADMTQKIVLVEAAVNKLANNVLSVVMPVIDNIFNATNGILQWLVGHSSAAGAIGGGILGLLGLSALTTVMKVATPIVEGLGAAITALDLPIVAAAAAIAGLGATAYGIYETYKHWGDIKNDLKNPHSEVNKYDTVKGIEWMIAKAEGFFSKRRNIPQEAHNPGDILYGSFARQHGATGYMLAAGGKKVARFATDEFGWEAMHDLLQTPAYQSLIHSGLSPEEAKRAVVERWQTGKVSSMVNGIHGAGSVASSVSGGSHTSNIHTDNSRTTHVGSVVIQNPSGTGTISPSMVRGMDWSTLLTQSAFGLQ